MAAGQDRRGAETIDEALWLYPVGRGRRFFRSGANLARSVPRERGLFTEATQGTHRGLGEDASVYRSSISSPRYSVEVQHGCNALLPTALFVSAALASPVAFALKIPGIVIGTIALMLMNLVRIVSMFYLGIYMPKSFNMMHAHVWPGIFICFSLLLWIAWAVWARERGGGLARVTG